MTQLDGIDVGVAHVATSIVRPRTRRPPPVGRKRQYSFMRPSGANVNASVISMSRLRRSHKTTPHPRDDSGVAAVGEDIHRLDPQRAAREMARTSEVLEEGLDASVCAGHGMSPTDERHDGSSSKRENSRYASRSPRLKLSSASRTRRMFSCSSIACSYIARGQSGGRTTVSEDGGASMPRQQSSRNRRRQAAGRLGELRYCGLGGHPITSGSYSSCRCTQLMAGSLPRPAGCSHSSWRPSAVSRASCRCR